MFKFFSALLLSAICIPTAVAINWLNIQPSVAAATIQAAALKEAALAVPSNGATEGQLSALVSELTKLSITYDAATSSINDTLAIIGLPTETDAVDGCPPLKNLAHSVADTASVINSKHSVLSSITPTSDSEVRLTESLAHLNASVSALNALWLHIAPESYKVHPITLGRDVATKFNSLLATYGAT